MIPLDSLLPELERAVHDRVESRTLSSMQAGELRDLVYKIVERNLTPSIDPLRHLSEIVTAAKERHRDLVDAREHSVSVRRDVLEELLAYVEPALPSLLGQIVVETVFEKDNHENRKHHDLLLGLEILSRRKQGPNGSSQIISGESYWIVGLPPDRSSQPISGRYAVMRHQGRTDDTGGRICHEISLISTDEAAEQIREVEFELLFERIVNRLLVVSGQKDPRKNVRGGALHKKERGGNEKYTDRLWRIAENLQAALAVMRGETP